MVLGVLGAIGAAVGIEALQAQGGPLERERVRSPQVQPGDILALALQAQALSERGLTPVISTDPFTGNQVISTSDQSDILETLLGEKFAREALAPSQAELDALAQARFQELVVDPPRVSFARAAAPVPSSMRDQIVGDLATSTARVVAPGVVVRRASDVGLSKRLGGPCAAANTGFTRLRCGRGGFT